MSETEDVAGPGEAEQGVLHDLNGYPENMRTGGLAALALIQARYLDTFGPSLPMRDVTSLTQQIRQCLVTLRDQEPGGAEGDATDGARARRERRLHVVQDSGA